MLGGIVQIVCTVLLFLILPRLLWNRKKEENLEKWEDEIGDGDKMT